MWHRHHDNIRRFSPETVTDNFETMPNNSDSVATHKDDSPQLSPVPFTDPGEPSSELVSRSQCNICILQPVQYLYIAASAISVYCSQCNICILHCGRCIITYNALVAVYKTTTSAYKL